MHGEIASEWKRAGGELTWAVRIPANTSAKIFVPSAPNSLVTEGGNPIEQASGLRIVRREKNLLICEASSGHYNFVSAL